MRPPVRDEALREFIQHYDLVILGAVAESPSAQMQINVERVYVGNPVPRVTLDQSSRPHKGVDPGLLELSPGDCSYTVLGGPGERYLLSLRRSPDGDSFRPSSCASWSLELVNRIPGVAAYFSTVEAISGGGIDPRDPSSDATERSDVPTIAIAVAAVAIPLAFVLAARFVFPARGSRP